MRQAEWMDQIRADVAYAVRRLLKSPGFSIVAMVLLDGFTPASIGVVVGSVAAVGLSRLMATLLFGTSPTDPLTYGVVAAVLLSVAALASYAPARRAGSVDPLLALRAD